MLLALRFEPKAKWDRKKQATYINILQARKLVSCEMNTKEDMKSRVRYWSWDRTKGELSMIWIEVAEVFGWREEIMRLVKKQQVRQIKLKSKTLYNNKCT